MTLIELTVSVVILGFLLGAIYSILTIQQQRAMQVSRTTVLQTDAQVAYTLVKWDLMMTGLGYPYDQTDAITLVPALDPTSCEEVNLKAVGLGFEMNRAHWSYLLDDVSGGQLLVRRWDQDASNIQVGDVCMILNESRQPIYNNLLVTAVDTTTYIDTLWGDSIPGLVVSAGPGIAARPGLIFIQRDAAIYNAGLTYRLSGDTLYRGNEALLTNVEAIQFRYGVDQDGDGVVETWDRQNAALPNPGYGRNWAVRFSMVVASEGITGFEYPDANVTIETDPSYTYALNDLDRRRNRVIVSSIIYPQNLQPGE